MSDQRGDKPTPFDFHTLILRQVSDAVISIDNDGHITYLNPSAEAQYGVVAADVVGRPLSELHRYEWIAPEEEARAAEALAEDGFWRGENRHVLRDGRVLHVDSAVSVLRDASGAAAGLLAVIRDITEKKRAEAALRESDERQRMALDAADLGTWQHDVTGGRVILDARARRHYGVADAEVDLGAVVSRIHPDDRPAVEGSIRLAMDPRVKAPVRIEYRVVLPDGATRWLSINGRVYFAGDKERERPVLGIGTSRDITDQKLAEAALRDADRRKDEFLAILAHELRNPLAPIRSAVGILRAPQVPDAVRSRSREIIERQVAHMTRLVDDLLDVSRLSSGKMQLQRAPVTLDQVLDAAIETARPVIEEHRHRFEDRRLATPVYVDGDLARLSQVFANLLNNAAKYTPAGGTIIVDVSDRGDDVEVRVIDTGQGISADRLDKIFTLFAQGSGAGSPMVSGLGIGLALARKLVELHGGSLTASSGGIGEGAAFTVTLPALPRAARADDDGPRPAATLKLNRRVLVVDDSVDAAETTALLLEAEGCATRAAFSGEGALVEAARWRPEIVLLDIGMPGLNGLEVCTRLRDLPGGESLFIVALTGWGQEEDRRKTREAGFDAHLVKPVAPEALFSLIERVPPSGAIPALHRPT